MRDCSPVAYLLSLPTFAITPTHILLQAAHTHTPRCHTIAQQLYSWYEALLFAGYNEILLKLMEIKMNIFFAWLKNIASIILATTVLACRIVLIFRNAVSRYILLIVFSIFAHCTIRHLQHLVLGSYKFSLYYQCIHIMKQLTEEANKLT